jgi:hypothetical protein
MSKAHGPCCISNGGVDHLLTFWEIGSFPATITWCVLCAVCCGPIRLQQYARDARKEYAELGSKDLSELKSFVKGLPKLLLLDRLSDLAVPVAEVVKQQVRAHLQAVGWDRPQGCALYLAIHWLYVGCKCKQLVHLQAAGEHTPAGCGLGQPVCHLGVVILGLRWIWFNFQNPAFRYFYMSECGFWVPQQSRSAHVPAAVDQRVGWGANVKVQPRHGASVPRCCLSDW